MQEIVEKRSLMHRLFIAWHVRTVKEYMLYSGVFMEGTPRAHTV